MLITGKHATYDVPEAYAKVLERFRCHLTENQGLIWSGLPAKTNIQWEPQTTIIKVIIYTSIIKIKYITFEVTA